MGLEAGTAARAAFLTFAYSLGLGAPFLIVALAMHLGMRLFGFARRHARMITVAGGGMLVLLGLLEVTGAWGTVIIWLRVHLLMWYTAPL